MFRLSDILQEATESRARPRTPDMSRAQLQAWMLEEANRLIDARKAIERPARPVWTNRIEHPEDAKYDPERDAINDAASQVAARLLKRDSADEDARW
jgi:hypothetical protein